MIQFKLIRKSRDALIAIKNVTCLSASIIPNHF